MDDYEREQLKVVEEREWKKSIQESMASIATTLEKHCGGKILNNTGLQIDDYGMFSEGFDKIADAINYNTEQMERVEAAIRMHAGQECAMTWIADRVNCEIINVRAEKQATETTEGEMK